MWSNNKKTIKNDKFAIESYLWVIVWFDSSELYVMVKDYNHLVLRDKIQSHPRSVYWMSYVIHKTELSQCIAPRSHK